ncbi:MAG TPA: hypothetical protein DCE41_11620, partial [Cytophagales bacterium]|nr:hypothetical protein [Cytophagales bacterium]
AWPNSGEIDILEHVGYEAGVVHGSAHTKLNNFQFGTQYTGTTPVPDATSAFHTYAIEWRADRIDYFVDDVHYFTAFRNANGWENYPFNHDFYFILNLAFGGDWGGLQGIDNNIFNRPEGVKLEVDYVRVYKRDYIALPGTVEAEDFTAMNGIQLEATTDTGGGENVGWTDAGDWMDYTVNVPTAGDYKVKYRVAGNGGAANLLLGGQTVDQVSMPSTSGWQDWTTVESTVTLPAGTATLRFLATTAGFNLNCLEVEEINTTPFYQKIEAESYSQMSGVQLENCSDAGGGQNVGWVDAGDWMIYPVDLPFAGDYTVSYRVASQNGGGHFRLDANAGSVILDEVYPPNTGGWQNWQTVTHTVNLPAGPQNLGIYAYAGGFNLNYIEISNGASQRNFAPQAELDLPSRTVSVFPNPSA